jgi:hypothetical protein
MPKLESRIGKPVVFKAPPSLPGARKLIGKVVDEVWANENQRDPRRHNHDDPNCWGHYAFFAQLIEWQEGGHSIRLGYYRLPCKGSHWIFAGQTTIETKLSTVKHLLELTLARGDDWFSKPDKAED